LDTFWIVTKDLNSADFSLFNEDSSICPAFVNQMKWNYLSTATGDITYLNDNRIQFKCKPNTIKKIIPKFEPPKRDANDCCKGSTVHVKIPGDAGEQFGGTYHKVGQIYENRSTKNIIKKVSSYWGLANGQVSLKQFIMYS